MNVFSQAMGHEQVVFCHDAASGLRAIIAIHDTTLGPALGGTRLLPYATEEEALRDVLRLSRGMTYKAACAGLQLGGGKAVIIAHPNQKSEALFKAYGRFVESLGGRYITAEDMNTNVSDMDAVRTQTRCVTGVSPWLGGSGDPSSLTALGTFHGILATVKHRLGRTDLAGLRISLQGVGSVGSHLAQMLHAQGAELFLTDANPERLEHVRKQCNAKVVSAQDIYKLDVDVYAPCAMGATLNTENIKQLKAKVVAGCANNQLEDELTHDKMLKDRGILYAPDYVINAGGLINVASELTGYNRQKVEHEVAAIGHTLETIYHQAEKMDVGTQEAAHAFAEQRLKSNRQIKHLTTTKNFKLYQH